MEFMVEVRVVPRRGILDPQGKAVHSALSALGFAGIEEVHVGRLIRIGVAAASAEEAEQQAISMCRQLLANPVTEDFEVQVARGEEASR